MLNRVTLIGNVGQEPQVRTTQSGSKVVTLSIATSDTWKDKVTGERKEKTEWHRVVIFNPQLVELSEKYIRKGSKLFIEGALQTRSYENSDGKQVYQTEVVIQQFGGQIILLGNKKEEQPSVKTYSDMDDDLPF